MNLHKYNKCPKCKFNLIGKKIPKKYQEFYGVGNFRGEIAVYDWDLDRTVAWQCPKCDYKWPRE